MFLHLTGAFGHGIQNTITYLDPMTYVLHYAPDNASIIVRMTLEALGVPYETALVDRSTNAQRSPVYLKLNPSGRIPVLETPDGVMHETAAILLWLTDRHQKLAPQPKDVERAAYLTWLSYCANTVHPTLTLLFYPHYTVKTAHQIALQTGASHMLHHQFSILNDAQTSAFGTETVTPIDFYIAAMLRWSAIYGTHIEPWLNLPAYPKLASLAARVEQHPAAIRVQTAEGLGPTPFTHPRLPTPPEGSAL